MLNGLTDNKTGFAQELAGRLHDYHQIREPVLTEFHNHMGFLGPNELNLSHVFIFSLYKCLCAQRDGEGKYY